MYMASKAENNNVNTDLQQLLEEYRAAKKKEEAVQLEKAKLPDMLRQKSAPLWDHMLNPREDGSVDPLNLAAQLENGDITYDKAVELATEYYKKEQGGGKKKKSRRKRRKRKRKTKKRRRRKKRKTKKRYINQRGCSRKRKR